MSSSAIPEEAPAELPDPHRLLERLRELRQTVVAQGRATFEGWEAQIKREEFRPSALNLAMYLALRCHDLRALQADLAPWGLSSLGRGESHVLPNLDAVLRSLGAICAVDAADLPERPGLAAFAAGDQTLRENARRVLGDHPERRAVRIMVTLPSEAASSPELVAELVRRGATCFRVNCAHDTPQDWEAMIHHVRRAAAESRRDCKVELDLVGPRARIGAVIGPEGETRLKEGDRFLLARRRPRAETESPVAVCTLPEVLAQLRVGHAVLFDEGRMRAEVEEISPGGALVRVTRASAKGFPLRPEQALNFPDTPLHLNPLTEQDLENLDFAVAHADMVGFSFVQGADDIAALQEQLARRAGQGNSPAIVAKIETARAVRNLPEIIVRAAGRQPFAVMIARGDLAVEIGYERLAEIQEEVLWLCEAAHVPVIWATQVLDRLAKKGVPTRAEMTDAAMAERADCVMLNKGPYLARAVSTLDDVLTRMQGHQQKKAPQLRALKSWRHLVHGPHAEGNSHSA
jgi:pyruvate kinase